MKGDNFLNKLNNMTPTESKDFRKILKTIKNDRNKNDEDNSLDLNLFANHCKSQENPEKNDSFSKFHFS